jgi:Ca-activated chloride channel homolog
MPRWLPALLLALSCTGAAHAAGLLIPTDKEVPPLGLRSHQVEVSIEDQVAVTRVTQVFANHTDRPLEATYVFPVPKGASVKKFSMWVDGKEVSGELVEAGKARSIYTDIVRRTQDPGLLEYMDSNLLRLRVFPVPAHGEQKLALSYTSVAECDAGLVEYVYPLKADAKSAQTLDKFSLEVTLKTQHPLQNVYSPTHAVTMTRPGDRQARVTCEKEQAVLDRDFQLFYTISDKDVGLTALTHRPSAGEGCFMLLIAPRAELAKTQQVSRDMVFVLDTSGSMAGVKMEQAKRALKYCLDNLDRKDHFAVLNFATSVNQFRGHLVEASTDQVEQGKKWVDNLQATGGTAIDAALAAALDLRTSDSNRPFTVVFFTDGQPTVGETNPEKILKNVAARNTASTRIFTFGVGDDVNAALLDQLAEQTRAVCTYVRPAEDIEVKVSSLYAKISHPVLTNLKLTAGGSVTLEETYPAQLPDLFHGSQLVVLGRYHGHGHAAVTLTGSAGEQTREFVYEVNFPEQTGSEKAFVEDLWARRKVGFLLDQVRRNGEKKELVDEIVSLAKKHGITTPYTSYLVVPDVAAPLASAPTPHAPSPHVPLLPPQSQPGPQPRGVPHTPTVPLSAPQRVPASPEPSPAGAINYAPAFNHAYNFVTPNTTAVPAPMASEHAVSTGLGMRFQVPAAQNCTEEAPVYEKARGALAQRLYSELQTGSLGVDFALQLERLRTDSRVAAKATRQAAGRTCVDVGGVWLDAGYDAKMARVSIKAQGEAYFRILEKHPEMKEVFQLGNQVVWVTPSGKALVIGPDGADKLADEEIDRLFAR